MIIPTNTTMMIKAMVVNFMVSLITLVNSLNDFIKALLDILNLI